MKGYGYLSCALLLSLAALLSACSHADTIKSFDVVRQKKLEWVSIKPGHIYVIDICATWSDMCLSNARAIDAACKHSCGPKVHMMSILLDQESDMARHAYASILQVSQEVFTPGPRSALGQSDLGDLKAVPRLLVLDQEGRIREDYRGGLVATGELIQVIQNL